MTLKGTGSGVIMFGEGNRFLCKQVIYIDPSNCGTQGHKHPIIKDKCENLYSTRNSSIKCHTGPHSIQQCRTQAQTPYATRTGSKCHTGPHSIQQYRTQAQTPYSTRTGSKCHTGPQAYNNIGLKLRLYTQPGLALNATQGHKHTIMQDSSLDSILNQDWL